MKTLESRTFYACSSIISVTIPKSITAIKESAFWPCYALTDVYYAGSESEWKDIAITEKGNDALTRATVHYNNVVQPVAKGDVDGDEEITMKDVLIMRRYVSGLNELENEIVWYGDLNGDYEITMKDVLRSRRIIAGLD